MVSKIAVQVRPALDRQTGSRLRQSLMSMPGVQQVTIVYPNRVEVHYDQGGARASGLLRLIRAHGLKTGPE